MKKYNYLYLPLVLLFVILSACSEDTKKLEETENTEQINFDSTKTGKMSALDIYNDGVKDASQGSYDNAVQKFQAVREYSKQNDIPQMEIQAMHSIAKSYAKLRRYDSAFYYFDISAEYAKAANDSAELADIYSSRAFMYKFLMDFKTSATYYDSALALYTALKDTLYLIQGKNEYSKIQFLNKDNKGALQSLTEAYILADKANSKYFMALSAYNLGNFYLALNDLQESENYFLKAVQYISESEDKSLLPEIRNNLGLLYINRGDISNARKSFSAALKANESINNIKERALSYEYLGRVMHMTGNNEGSLKNYAKSLELNTGRRDTLAMIKNLNDIGMIHNKAANQKEGITYLLQALHLADQANNKQIAVYIVNNIEKAYESIGDKAKAAEFAKIKEEIVSEIKKIQNDNSKH